MSNTTPSYAARLMRPFRFGGRVSALVLSLFVAINGIVFVNAALHDPRIGYDAHHHLDYAWTLAQGRLPTIEDSFTYFSAPLPYVPSALAYTITGDKHLSAKAGQLANALLSIVLTFHLLRICRLLSPRVSFATGALLLLGMMPVYYKTFAFIRGESWAACFTVVSTYYALRIFSRGVLRRNDALALGVSLGLAALSRQWGVLLFPAVGLLAAFAWLRRPRARRAIFLCALLAFGSGGTLGGWFYLVLKSREGSAAAFNMERARTFSLTNQPPGFFTSLGGRELFKRPVRPAFEGQFLPQFYSELWGDYRCYFAVYGWDTKRGDFVTGNWLKRARDVRPGDLVTNYRKMGRHLGNVNLLALLPSALCIAAVFAAVPAVLARKTGWRTREALLLLLATIALTMAGYFWYLVMHPARTQAGLAVRATHVLQVFPLVAILAGALMQRIALNRPVLHRILFVALVLVALHSLPAMISHYTFFTARP